MRKLKISSYITILIILLFILPGAKGFAENTGEPPQALKGIMDLREWDFKEFGPIALKGEWEFYWQEFPPATEGPSEVNGKQKNFFTLPNYWNHHKIDGKTLSGEGYAGFRLTVLLPPGFNVPLAVGIQEIQTAYRLFINGNEIDQTGRPGTDRDSSVPYYSSTVTEFIPDSDTLEILLHVSNFHHRKGGVWKTILLGPADVMKEKETLRISLDMILISGILIMGLYHIVLFMLRKKDTMALYFGLFCLVIALRTLTTGEMYLYRALPNARWQVLHRLEYLSFYISVPVFLMYLKSLFPKDLSVLYLRIILALGTIFSLAVIVLPARMYTHTVQVYQGITVLGGLYAVAVLLRGIKKKREGSLIIFLGFLAMFTLAVNDMLHSSEIIHTGYYMPTGLLIFIFSQAYLIALRSSRMFETIEAQTKTLQKTNTALNLEILEREKLEENLLESHEQFQRSRIGIILGLAKLAEYRDEDTGSHLERIREYSRLLAKELSYHPDYQGYITEEYLDDLYQSSILHDIGKIGVPDSILLKPGKLTPEEFEIIKRHTVIGGDAISNVESKINIKSFLTLGKEIAYNHHEKWDGNGYPRGLSGKNIPLSARIVALADVYDALLSERPYKKAFSHEKTRDIT